MDSEGHPGVQTNTPETVGGSRARVSGATITVLTIFGVLACAIPLLVRYRADLLLLLVGKPPPEGTIKGVRITAGMTLEEVGAKIGKPTEATEDPASGVFTLVYEDGWETWHLVFTRRVPRGRSQLVDVYTFNLGTPY
jgi:hypothetical protein